MKTVYVIAYYTDDPEGRVGDKVLRIAGVYDTIEQADAAQRPGDISFETTYFEQQPSIQVPPWSVKGPDYTIRTTCTGTKQID